LIALTQQLAKQVHDVFRRGLPKPVRLDSLPVVLQAGSDGLRLRSWLPNAAIEYFQPGKLNPEQFTVPLDAFKACAGTKAEPVSVEAAENSQVIFRWNDRDIPQVVSFDVPLTEGEFPPIPERMQKAGEGFLQALRDAIDQTDINSIRYALDCVRLRSTGQIDASDTRQALVQCGFKFPWDKDVLVPANPLFKSAVFTDECEVRIGHTDDWVTFELGPWTIHLRIETDRRFPDVEGCLPAPTATKARLRLCESDARFLQGALSRLPSDEDTTGVTIDLNGAVLIRARSTRSPVPTEIFLAGSTCSGKPMRVSTDRRFLERAIRLGFREIGIVASDAPLVCRDGRRTYFWMALGNERIVKPAANAVRIESMNGQDSSVAEPAAEPKPVGGPRRRSARTLTSIEEPADARPVQESEPLPAAGIEPELGKQTDPPARPTIEQALHLRDELRSALEQTRQLISCIRRDRKRSRLAIR
jgi:hypothetical protein